MLTFLSIIFIIDDPFFRQPIVSDIVYSIRDRSPVDGKEWELIIFLWFNIYLRYWYMITSSFYGRNQGSVWSSHPFIMIRYLVKIQAWVELSVLAGSQLPRFSTNYTAGTEFHYVLSDTRIDPEACFIKQQEIPELIEFLECQGFLFLFCFWNLALVL